MVVFKGRTEWILNPPIVNMNTNPKENIMVGVNLIDPPYEVAQGKAFDHSRSS